MPAADARQQRKAHENGAAQSADRSDNLPRDAVFHQQLKNDLPRFVDSLNVYYSRNPHRY